MNNNTYRRKEASYVDHNLDRFLVSIYYSKEDADDGRRPIVSKTFDYEDEADEYVANLGSRYGQEGYYVMEVLGEDDESYEWDEGYLFDSDHFSNLQGKKVLSRGDEEDNEDSPAAEEDDPISTDKTPPGETDDLPAPGEELDSFLYRDAVNAVRKATVGLQAAIDHFERDIPQSTFDELVDDLEGLREKLEEIVRDTEAYLNPEEYNV